MCPMQNSILKNITFALVIASFVLFCGGIGLSTAMAPHHAMPAVDSAHHGQTEQAAEFACCTDEAPMAQMTHDYLPMSRSLQDLLQVIVVAIAVAVVLVNLYTKNTHELVENIARRMRSLRQIYGSPHILNPFVNLFSAGILHPKIW